MDPMMETTALPAIALIPAIVLLVIGTQWRRAMRAEYIRTYSFPPGLYKKLQTRRPELTLKDCQLIGHGLRQFFLAYLKCGCKFVSMPSQIADDLCHEMILYTKYYEAFCHEAFGRFLHHTPAIVLGQNRTTNAGLRRTWWFTCREENIDPRRPTRLPLLFALDAKFNIVDGFHCVPDCQALRRNGNGSAYCGGDFSDSRVDGSTDGFGDSTDGNGGDGGGGCGGGCGGD
jgi:hypothetical protein